MPSKVRMERIEDRFKQVISELLLREVNDPRLHQVFITDVKVDREFSFADIYVSAIEGTARSEEILSGLNSASGYLRRELAARVDLRSMPRLRFHWDPTPENADHIEKLIMDLHKKNE